MERRGEERRGEEGRYIEGDGGRVLICVMDR